MAGDKITGYIIRTKKYRDNDVIITLLTPKGLKTIFGKGYKSPKSKFHVLNNLFLKVTIFGQIKKNISVQDFEIRNDVNFSRSQYDILVTMYSIVELTIRNAENEKAQKMYQYFEAVVDNIDEKNFERLYCWYLAKLLQTNGINLDFKRCVSCGNNMHFQTLAIVEGGLICANCYQNQRFLQIDEIRETNIIFNGKINDIIESKIMVSEQIKKEILTLINETLGIYIKENIWH